MGAHDVALAYRAGLADTSEFVEAALERDGKPYRFFRRNHLRQIYDDPGDILLKCSRQTEKSTSLSNRAGAYLYAGQVIEEDGKPRPIRVLYFSASWLQAADFSKDRLARVLESGCFVDSLAGGLPLWPKDRNTRSRAYIDQIGEKVLRNGAAIKLRACHLNADRVRGVSADVIFGDEIQDVLVDLFPVIEETAARSPLKKKIYAGTPKTYENAVEEHWVNSTQFEWMIRCGSCYLWQFLDEKNIGREWFHHTRSGCVCRDCRKPIDPQDGQWVSFSDKPDPPLRGYRICHIMLPQSHKGWGDILDKWERYPEQQFVNEVLGFSHEHSNVVLSKANMIQACDPSRSNGGFPYPRMNGLTAGIDWGMGGRSQTVLVIGGFYDDVFRVLYMKNFRNVRSTRDDIISFMVNVCRQWHVPLICPDFAAGIKENQDLARVAHGVAQVVPIAYNASAKSEVGVWNENSKFVSVNRTKTLANLFNIIQRKQLHFFRHEDMIPFLDGFIYTTAELTPRTQQLAYIHPDSKPDDELQATNYAYLGAAMQTSGYGLRVGRDTLVK